MVQIGQFSRADAAIVVVGRRDDFGDIQAGRETVVLHDRRGAAGDGVGGSRGAQGDQGQGKQGSFHDGVLVVATE